MGYNDFQEKVKIVCSECGKEDFVNFKPDGVRKVYCRECYRKRRPPRFNPQE
jgi:CxxC-x17-CxxC domain-containing protein